MELNPINNEIEINQHKNDLEKEKDLEYNEITYKSNINKTNGKISQHLIFKRIRLKDFLLIKLNLIKER